MHKRVVYSGTFDPITLGHVDLVKRALRMFDEVVIAVSTGFGKKTLFTLEERVTFSQEIFKGNTKVSVQPFDGLLVDFVHSIGGCAILRGLRAVSDFEYEFQMAAINRKLNAEVETIFLTPSEQFTSLSSTMIRQVALIDPERVSQLVHPLVVEALKQKNDKK
jgi:pantetheine-phosphate adenylyltransferase